METLEAKLALWVPGPLPGMNETLAAAKSGRGKGNAYSRLKHSWTDTVALLARAAKLPRLQRCRLQFRWLEKTRRRDPDNIASAKKYILDGLVQAGVLPGDGWDHVVGWDDFFALSTKPGVYVLLIPE